MNNLGMIHDEMVKWRRHLHQNPELSFQEKNTATFISDNLSKIPGINVQTGVGYPTSVVGTLSSGNGPTIAIRADMDALPIHESNTNSYKSRHHGVMHACGHDAHTAIGLGVARILSNVFQRKELKGTIKFIFQPAEEHVDESGYSGGAYMVKAGVLDEVDAVIALHMSPEEKIGEVKIHDGYSMANVDVFKGVIHGTGGHGAYPHIGTDPFWMLNHVLQNLYGITGRRITPLEPAVISIGKIQGGMTSNVIPSKVEIEGTVRSYHPRIKNDLRSEIEKSFSIVEKIGGSFHLEWIEEDPALYNNPRINQLFKKVINDKFPSYRIIKEPFGLGGEDFAHMTKKVPGAMFFLGCALEDGKSRGLHTPYFDIDEKALSIGATILSETAMRFLGEGF